jgi:hypothetical protein
MRSQRTGANLPPSDASDAHHSEDYRALFKKWMESPYRPDGNIIVVDSTVGPEDCLRNILEHLVLAPSA